MALATTLFICLLFIAFGQMEFYIKIFITSIYRIVENFYVSFHAAIIYTNVFNADDYLRQSIYCMKKIKRFLQYIYCIYALLWFIVLMFIVLIFVFISFLFGKIKSGNLIYIACNCWARIWYGLIGIHHKEMYEVPHDRHKQYIFVANHSSYMDIPCIVRGMHQPIRVLGKYEMVKYPVFGFIYRAAVILVDRRSAEKRAQSVRALKAAIHKNISIFIFPEGTFNESNQPLKSFYDGAFRIAIETQTPIKPILYLDNLERMHWRGFFELTPGKCRVVYLDEISVADYNMNDLQKLKQTVHDIMDAGLRRYRNYPAG
jgi:1-acyl-sn-glycerol-3-phosphate acyltransferase